MSLAFALLLLIFAVAFVIRMPLAYGMISAGIVYLLVSGADLGNASQLIASGFYSKFVLIAVPLFIFGAQVMNASTVSARLFHFAHGAVGRLHGGLAQVNVVNSVIFSGMSGSAVADASGVGIMEIEAMRRAGYPKAFACALTASTATIGPIIPPSIPMVIYAYLSGSSVGMLFAGGMGPGILMAALQMALVSWISKRRGYPREAWPGFANLIGRFVAALPALLAPVILLVGIYTGAFTPTEAAAVASVYALLLAFFVHRALTPRAFLKMLTIVLRQTAIVSLIIGGAFLVNFAIANEGVPRQVASAILSITDNPLALLLLVNVMFLILGCFFDTIILLLVAIPIVLPVMTAAEIDPIHFGVVITMNMMIGMCMPPVGVLLLIVSGMTRTPLKDVIREIWPFNAILFVTLIILIFFPDVVLVFPRMLGYDG